MNAHMFVRVYECEYAWARAIMYVCVWHRQMHAQMHMCVHANWRARAFTRACARAREVIPYL